MADEMTQRLGLPIYTSGAEQHPTREDFNDRMRLLEEAVAIARQGTREDRPLPSTRGTLFLETDTGLLWFDTGDEWIRVVKLGHDGPGRPLDIGGDGAEGESEWAARTDHTHPLPLATASQPGALSADDKKLLNTASANSTSNALARRNGSGQMSTAAPTAASHVTPRSYVDQQTNTRAPSSHAHNADDVDRGTLAPGRLPTATQSAQGAMSPADKTKLDHASSTSTDTNQLMSRNGDGQTGVATPTHGNHAASKHYVDGEISGHRHHASDVTGGTLDPARLPLATQSQQGAMIPADKSLLDSATWWPDPDSLARRSSNGRIKVGDPGALEDATNKSYVDRQVGNHTHAASDVNSGTLDPERLPEATQADQGAMSAIDKRLLDEATGSVTGSTLMRRFASGQTNVADPDLPTHAANRRYVDAVGDRVSGVESELDSATPSSSAPDLIVRRDSSGLFGVADPTANTHPTNKRYVDEALEGSSKDPIELGTRNLNDARDPGAYSLWGYNNATSSRNYPAEDGGGLIVTDLGANWKMQEYTVRGDLVTYRRRYNGSDGTWSSWRHVTG